MAHNVNTRKYYAQRYRLFHKFDEGCQLDEEGWYSVTPEKIAAHIADRFEGMSTVVDFFAGPGGNCIQFALKDSIESVIGIDINRRTIDMFRNNAKVYGVHKKMRYMEGDVYDIAPVLKNEVKIDAIFMSPPWGGPSYRNSKHFDVSLFKKPVELARSITPNVCILVPRNVHAQNVYDIFGECEIENNFYGNKLKTRSIYFGDLRRNAKNHRKRAVPMKKSEDLPKFSGISAGSSKGKTSRLSGQWRRGAQLAASFHGTDSVFSSRKQVGTKFNRSRAARQSDKTPRDMSSDSAAATKRKTGSQADGQVNGKRRVCNKQNAMGFRDQGLEVAKHDDLTERPKTHGPGCQAESQSARGLRDTGNDLNIRSEVATALNSCRAVKDASERLKVTSGTRAKVHAPSRKAKEESAPGSCESGNVPNVRNECAAVLKSCDANKDMNDRPKVTTGTHTCGTVETRFEDVAAEGRPLNEPAIRTAKPQAAHHRIPVMDKWSLVRNGGAVKSAIENDSKGCSNDSDGRRVSTSWNRRGTQGQSQGQGWRSNNWRTGMRGNDRESGNWRSNQYRTMRRGDTPQAGGAHPQSPRNQPLADRSNAQGHQLSSRGEDSPNSGSSSPRSGEEDTRLQQKHVSNKGNWRVNNSALNSSWRRGLGSNTVKNNDGLRGRESAGTWNTPLR